MATEQRLVLHQHNDESIEAWVSSRLDAEPYDLDDATVQMVIKPDAETDDTASDVIVLSSATGEVEVTNAEEGQVRVHVARAHLARAGLLFWRLDVVRPGARRTAVYGDLRVIDM